MNIPPTLFIELGRDSWQVLHKEDVFDIPIRLDASGLIADANRLNLIDALRAFLSRQGLRGPVRALCALRARGVSLRRLKLPATAKEQLTSLLALQIESEFPLPPDQLAWGSRLLREADGRLDVLLAAVKKQAIQPYEEILAACGIAPLFTVAALIRASANPAVGGIAAVLDLGKSESELVCLEDGFPASIRVVGWGTENSTTAGLNGGLRLSGGLQLAGISASDTALAAQLSQRLGVHCEPAPAKSSGQGTIVRALRASVGKESACPPLLLNAGETKGSELKIDAKSRRWLAAAAVLLLAVLLFPFAEALAFKPFLEHKLNTFKAGGGRLAAIDRELGFLQYVKQNQPPYLDTLFLLSKSAPPGTSFDSFSMGRRGEISIHGKLSGSQQVTELRNKMIDSGWFSSVVVEEQTPTPNRQVNVHMTAQLKSADGRPPLADETSSDLAVKTKSTK